MSDTHIPGLLHATTAANLFYEYLLTFFVVNFFHATYCTTKIVNVMCASLLV